MLIHKMLVLKIQQCVHPKHVLNIPAHPHNSFHVVKLKLCPHSTLSHHLPFLLSPGSHDSAFCLYEFQHSEYLIQVDSYNICPFVTDLFYLASPLGLFML